ncbi:MAG: hypothetical protein LBS06_06205 [Treponema sp.]|jgi:hypothetical protein|nr:hypothetical protein [Treponema sp.]
MFNLKWSGTAAGFGVTLSFFVSIVTGAGIFRALFRALVFGVVFFVLAAGIRFLVDRFLPDLLSGEEDGAALAGVPGARVDISVGDGEEESALPSALPDDSQLNEEPGNIADLLSRNIVSRAPAAFGPMRGMDQKEEDGYTGSREQEFQPKTPNGAAGIGSGEKIVPPVSGDLRPAEVLPDLGSMAEVFRPGGEPESVSGGRSSFDGPGGGSGRGKGQNMAGDFNPKDLASAIQTILSKD